MQENLPSLSKPPDIICLSLSRWDAPISSPALSLAKELGKTHRVFYIEHPFSLKDLISERNSPQVKRRLGVWLNGSGRYAKGAGFTEHLRSVTPGLAYPINFLGSGKLYNLFSRMNDRILQNTVRKVIRENDVKEFVFINFFDPFFLRKLPRDIRALKFVYQCMDDLSQVEYTARHGLALEEQIIRNADITLCTSRELTRLKSAISPNVHFHPNGADTELFSSAFGKDLPRPGDLPAHGKKIIGFVGSIEYRTDFDLLRKLALHHSDKLLYMVGPVIGEEHVAAGLDKIPNIVFAGHRELTQLPAYVQHFDCCIIPYKKNILTRSIYPLKINEYLAAGKPVVATDFSEDIIAFNDVAYVASDHAAFIAAIDTALTEDSVHKRVQRLEVARSNSWGKRAEEFWRILNLKVKS